VSGVDDTIRSCPKLWSVQRRSRRLSVELPLTPSVINVLRESPNVRVVPHITPIAEGAVEIFTTAWGVDNQWWVEYLNV
jgi:hypothetical protein